MNIFSLLATLILVAYFACLLMMDKRPDVNVVTAVDNELKINSSTLEFKKFSRLDYLYTIALALEEYKRKNFTYPISQGKGNSWSLKISSDGEISKGWIPGIDVIKFEDKLISSNRAAEQYAYISDGINYKLIAINPDDCSRLEKAYPELISYHNELCGYGFWTYHPD